MLPLTKRNLLQSCDRYGTVVELGCCFQDLRTFRGGHLEGQKNLTLTLGLRYDDSGNPCRRARRPCRKLLLGYRFNRATAGGERLCQGYPQRPSALGRQPVQSSHRCRVGSYGEWRLGGTRWFRVYNNWLTQANVQEEFRGSPPGEVAPTFVAGGTASAQAPIFVLGTGTKPPFGFTSRLSAREQARRRNREAALTRRVG